MRATLVNFTRRRGSFGPPLLRNSVSATICCNPGCYQHVSLCPGILFMSCWYLWVPRVIWHAPRHPSLRAEAVQPAARVCANDAQSRACWPAEATLVYVYVEAGPPSPCFASFEGVSVTNPLFHNRWKPMLACPGQPWTVKCVLVFYLYLICHLSILSL